MKSCNDCLRWVLCRVPSAAVGLWTLQACVIPVSSAAPPNTNQNQSQTSSGGGGSGGGSSSGSGADSTLKGPIPTGSWVNVTGNLAGVSSGCGTLVNVDAKPDEDFLIAGVTNAGLYGTRDGGSTWQQITAPSGAGSIDNRMTMVIFDPTTSTRFWECGIYGDSPFVTTDDGKSWTQMGMISHTDLLGIDFTDPDRKTMVAGGHEQSQTLYKSTDSGNSWSGIGSMLPMNTNCTLPVVFDSETYLVGCGGYGGGPSGIYRTTDGGSTWTNVSSMGGAAPPLVASDGTIYWASPGGAALAKSTDKGMTWTQAVGPNVVTASVPIELPDGRVAILGSQYVIASSDQGATWSALTNALPTPGSGDELTHGIAYSTKRNAIYIWHSSCPSGVDTLPIDADAVMRYDL
jgi:photosystem II stability/assembly factor-like uncharacterized protein